MGSFFEVSRHVSAGSQFLGTEFPVNVPLEILVVREIHLRMGSESKTYTIRKAMASGWTSVIRTATSTDTGVILTGEDAGFVLFPNERIEIVTSGASSSMDCQLVCERAGS